MLSESSKLSYPGQKQRPRKRVYCLPAGYSGCAFWRYRIPLQALQRLGCYFDIDIADNPNKMVRMQDIQEHIKIADAISIQSPGNKDTYTLIKLYKSEGKKVVIDYDDYSFNLSPGNPRYRELGIRECELDGMRWRDGENGFDLKANIAKYEGFKECLGGADLVTTTTDYLAGIFRKHAVNVVVCPNSIDFNIWKPIPRAAPNHEIRIGWFGGDSHYVDLKIFKNILPEICKKYPAVKIVIQGPQVETWRDIFQAIPSDRLEWHGWTDLRYYPYFLASRDWDIGLCPLEDNEFNRCKSNIKALEFMALGVAVIAQDIPPYGNSLTHNQNSLLAGTEQEWLDCVSRFVENAALRNTIAMAGYYWARENFNINQNCRIWEKTYSSILGIEMEAVCGSN